MVETVPNHYSEPPNFNPDFFLLRFGNPEWLPNHSDIIRYFNNFNSAELCCFLRTYDIRFIHEFFSLEFVDHLSQYLIDQFNVNNFQPREVLEICAGDGLLTHHLNQRLNPFEIKVIPTDSKTSRIYEAFPVETLNHQQAIDKYQARIVLCSWMPRNLDLTPSLREAQHVSEYILIGDPQVCGHPTESWLEEYPDFRRHPINSVHQFQFGLTDSPVDQIFKSQTFSFRRKV